MTDKNKDKRIFSNTGGIPPMFSEGFRETGTEWQRIEGLNFEIVGRILTCHLIIEHYITKLIELETPKEFDWIESRLTFSQKLKLVRKIAGLVENDIHKGFEIINKIRNKFSHNLIATIDKTYVEELKKQINRFSKKIKSEEIDSDYDDIFIIEMYTSLSCSYIAGYCTNKVMINEEIKESQNEIKLKEK